MKTRSLLLIASATAALAAVASGCFPGPNDIPGTNRNEDPPIVVTDLPPDIDPQNPSDFTSLDVEVPFTVYDPDSTAATLWDECPYPGGSPILRVGFSIDGGSSFSGIDPADLQVDGQPLTVPSCGDVESFDESIRLVTSSSGEAHTITWNSVPYVPSSADITFRIAVSDRHYTSEPGDRDFTVANLPAFSVVPKGARPGEMIVGAEATGLLTSWDGTTVVGSADNLTVTNFTASSSTAGTFDFEMGADTDQIPRVMELITPGAGIPSGDEVAEATIWTCNVAGMPVEEFETAQIGGGDQYICSQPNNWSVEGDLTTADSDFYEFVASSSGDLAFSLSWAGAGGDVDDYDAYVFDPTVGLASCADDLLGCACATVNSPETGTITGLVAGRSYILYISHYAGAELPYTADIGN